MTEQLTEQYAPVQEEAPTAPPAPVRISWAPIARVNLLPIEIIESRRFRRTQMMLGGAVLGAVVLAGAGTFLAERSIGDAKDQLAVSQAQVMALQAEQAKFAAVPAVIAQVDAAVAARSQAMASDVLWYRYLNEVDGARPAGVELSGMTVAVTTAVAPTTSNSPLAAAGIGAVTFEGTTDQYEQVSTWLEAVNKITGFSSPLLTNAAKADSTGIVTFSMSAVIDTDALSDRYTKDAG
jgi:Tfp pilus assembly protein PilN